MERIDGIEVIFCKNRTAWESWLAHNFKRNEGVWLKLARANSGIRSVTRVDALDVALCYGWIDGQGKPYKLPVYYLQKYTPRRPRSTWSKVNIGKVEKLISVGRMQAPGFAAIEAAKADGRWARAYESQRNMTMPEDFAAALAEHPKARSFFDTFNRADRYAFLWRVSTAKTPTARGERILKYIAMLEAGRRFR